MVLSVDIFVYQTSQFNCNKLQNLFIKPLTNWKSATTAFDAHQSGHCKIHEDATLDEKLFIDFENGTRTGIDVLMKEGIEKRISDNHIFLKSIVDTVLISGLPYILIYFSEGSS